MRILLLIFSLVGFFNVNAQQEYISFSGRLIDAESKEGLSFATLNIEGSQNGVVTNDEGYFEFTFPKKHIADKLTASMVGYEALSAPIKDLLGKQPLILKMVTKPYMLDEVIVTPGEELTAREIVDLIRKSIPKHYPQKPFEMEAFYRDYKIEDEKCVGLLEASVIISDKGYKHVPNPYHMQEKVKLNQVRKSLNNHFKAHVLANYNIMKGFLSLNDIRYRHRWLSKKFTKEFSYEKDGYAIINDRLMTVIKASSNDWVFMIYADAENYLVPKIEMTYEWEDDVFENEWTLYDSIRLEQRWAKEVLEFQEIEGMWLPKFHIFQAENITYDLHTNEQLVVSQVRQEFLVNRVNLKREEKIQKKEQMDQYEPLHLQVPSYDPEFWKNYNTIKLNERDESLVRNLEEQMKLEAQFVEASN
ncbi:MAG: carboxypeptidase-like regulatory domain-containing protein [Ekhidna sp.]|nr:carboxypeptidase-like regulatory domain-containing protein [Ekhidna sp.]